MELIKFKTRVIGNIVEIIPEGGFLDNSIYEIKLKGIQSDNGDELNKTLKLCTKLTPLFVDIYSVKSIIDGIDVPDDIILYHIREASRFAEYIKGQKISEENVPFEVSQFVRYKAAHESILRHMIHISSAIGINGTVGNVTFGEKETTKDISKLLDHLCKEVSKWIDDVKGFKMEGRASLQTAIKSGTNTPSSAPIGKGYTRRELL